MQSNSEGCFRFLVVLWFAFAAPLVAAEDTESVRICVGPLENHSSFQLPVEKLRGDFVSQLSHKNLVAIGISGQHSSAELAHNKCQFLVSGVFSDHASWKPGEVIEIGGIVVDGRKRVALRFDFDVKRSGEEKSIYSDQVAVIDKNAKTCADDQVYEAVRSIRAHFRKQ